ASPNDQSTGSPAPRIVRIGSAMSNSRYRREGSVLSNSERSESGSKSPRDLITPAPRLRTVRISGSRSDTRSPSSTSPSHGRSADRNSGDEVESAGGSNERRPRFEEDYV